MTTLEKALVRLLHEVEALSALQRVALIQRKPFGGIAPLEVALPILLALPEAAEEARVLAALTDGIRNRMSPTVRRSLVDVAFGTDLDADFARGLIDAIAGVVAVVDAEVTAR